MKLIRELKARAVRSSDFTVFVPSFLLLTILTWSGEQTKKKDEWFLSKVVNIATTKQATYSQSLNDFEWLL